MAESGAAPLALPPPPAGDENMGEDIEQQPAEEQQEQEEHEEVLARDDTNGIVVFGQFVAGSLVGIIISAPAFVVLFFGASGSLVTKADSKVREHLECEASPTRDSRPTSDAAMYNTWERSCVTRPAGLN